MALFISILFVLGAPFQQQSAQFLLGWKFQLVATGENTFVALVEHVFDDGIVLVGAEDQANRGVVLLNTYFTIKIVNVHLHLADVAMSELFCFQVDDHIALEAHVIEDQVRIEMIPVECESSLAGYKGESISQFQQKLLHTGRKSRLQVAFDQTMRFGKIEELQGIRVFDDVDGVLDH